MQEAFTKTDVEILLSTMNRQSLDFLLPMFPFAHFSNFNILIINQTTEGVILTSEHPSVRVINSFERGLSKSRNLALENAMCKLGVLADDDIVYKEDFLDSMVNAFNLYPDAALISFRIEKAPDVLSKKYPADTKTTLSAFDRLNIMSVEMVVNLQKVKAAGVSFNENFGLGAQFGMGEEALFVNALYRQQQQIVMQPKVLALHKDVSTTGRISVHDKYFVQGAVYSALYENIYMLWVFVKLFFDIKHSNVGLRQIPDAIRSAVRGRRKYKESAGLNHKLPSQ